MTDFHDACVRAERQCLEEFVTNVQLPSHDVCRGIIQRSGLHAMSILEAFGTNEYRAVQRMWDSGFTEHVVASFKGTMDDRRMHLLSDAIGILLNELCRDHRAQVKNKRVTYRGTEEIVYADPSIRLAHKSIVRVHWGLDA